MTESTDWDRFSPAADRPSNAGSEPDDRRPTLFLNRDTELDWLIAVEFGRVDEGQPSENWREVSEQFAFLCDEPDGRVIGFAALDFSEFDTEDPDVAEIWEGPRFDAPALGLTAARAGEIVLGARALFGDHDSINRSFFRLATNSEGQEAADAWLACLQSGDSMAHFGLGYTFYDLGSFQLAYRHLRHYCEIAPNHSWNWCWRGKTAEAIGETTEARSAYERALELEAAGYPETEARERLEALA